MAFCLVVWEVKIQAALANRIQLARNMLPELVLPCLALVYGLVVNPSTGTHGIPCLWKTFFGVSCPGCGLSRAWAFLIRGHWREAGEMNWLIFPLLVVYARHLVIAFVRSSKSILRNTEQKEETNG
jgi:hypothetical protein